MGRQKGSGKGKSINVHSVPPLYPHLITKITSPLRTNKPRYLPTIKMHISTLLAATLAAAPLTLAVGINAFNDPACVGFQEHYNLNANSKGNLASTRRSFLITQEQAGCHMKFYTGLNQQPNDASTLSFTTENRDWCFWVGDRQFRSFGFYCP